MRRAFHAIVSRPSSAPGPARGCRARRVGIRVNAVRGHYPRHALQETGLRGRLDPVIRRPPGRRRPQRWLATKLARPSPNETAAPAIAREVCSRDRMVLAGSEGRASSHTR